uniref:Toxin LaIT6 n=1 Tax=Liocheles australasiae TaxID=431266 RepID=KAXU6_LIOAU
MNAKFIYILLLTAVMFALYEASVPPNIPCQVTNQCPKPCREATGRPNSKCINGRCKCYG